MLIFFCRSIQVLVSTDCAGMGVHVPDLRLVVNVGMTMIEIFSQNCFLHTSIFQDFQGTCGKCPRHLDGPAETRSFKPLGYKCTGQARKVFGSRILTTRPNASELEIIFNFLQAKQLQQAK